MPAFFLESTLICARCGNISSPVSTPLQGETGETVHVTNEVACVDCDERIEYLMRSLMAFGGHQGGCAVVAHVENQCDCAWDDLFLALAALLDSS